MQQVRLPRFRRESTIPQIELTARDRHIIRLVHRHRFLRSHQISSLVGGSLQHASRRLKLLFHHGYLERPRAQLTYYYQGGSRSIVYGLGNKGGALLKQELGNSFREVSWGDKNHSIGRMFLEHALLVSDVMVTLELACRASGRIRIVHQDELEAQSKRRFKWRAQVNPNVKLGIVPDRALALEWEKSDGATERAYFFLEADRGTMPVKRSNLFQTSMYRKFLAYEATWSQDLHRTKFGFHRFRVLTVTKSAARVKSLVDACSQLERGHGIFLFADQSVLEKLDILSTPLWQTGRPNESTCLINPPTGQIP